MAASAGHSALAGWATAAGREDALLAQGHVGESDKGIVARSLKYLFEQLARRSGAGGPGGLACWQRCSSLPALLCPHVAARGLTAFAADCGGASYSLRVSFAEIYNEQVYDLIRFDKKQLPVRWCWGARALQRSASL